jgi:hypothetical protein
MKDALDLWWEWAQKPHESFLMIDADIHRPIMELPPEGRRDRAKVNEAACAGIGKVRSAVAEQRRAARDHVHTAYRGAGGNLEFAWALSAG